MASYGYPAGLVLHPQPASCRTYKECQPLLSIPGSRQDILRPDILNPRPHDWDGRWKSVSGQSYKIEPVCWNPFRNVQDTSPDSAFLSFGMDEHSVAQEAILPLLVSASSNIGKDGLDPTLLHSMGFEANQGFDMDLQNVDSNDFGSDDYVWAEQPLIYPSGYDYARDGTGNMLPHFLPHPIMSVQPDGRVLFVATLMEMKDLVAVLAELSLAKDAPRWEKRTMLVPHFRWCDTVRTRDRVCTSLALETVRTAPQKSFEKQKLKSTPTKRQNKKAIKERDLYQNNCLHTCETLLTLMMNKNQSVKTTIYSLKKSGHELPQLLTQFSACIAGTGLAVLFTVLYKVASGRVPFCASRLVTTSLGVGLFWLSGAVNKLRDSVVYITKNSGKSGFVEEEILKRVEKCMNNIVFRAAALMTVAVLRLA